MRHFVRYLEMRMHQGYSHKGALRCSKEVACPTEGV